MSRLSFYANRIFMPPLGKSPSGIWQINGLRKLFLSAFEKPTGSHRDSFANHNLEAIGRNQLYYRYERHHTISLDFPGVRGVWSGSAISYVAHIQRWKISLCKDSKSYRDFASYSVKFQRSCDLLILRTSVRSSSSNGAVLMIILPNNSNGYRYPANTKV